MVSAVNDEILLRTFLDKANAWVCSDYLLDVRFLASPTETGPVVWDASVLLFPRHAIRDVDFQIDATAFSVGQFQRVIPEKGELIEFVGEAVRGSIGLSNQVLTLPGDAHNRFYADLAHRDDWFSELHLQVSGSARPVFSSAELVKFDNELRRAHCPFDGLEDVANWLDLTGSMSSGEASSIRVKVSPPIDLIFDGCSLLNNQLNLKLHAHPKFDLSDVGLAIRIVPGNGLAARRQVADRIRWGGLHDGRLEGMAQIQVESADQVLAMLTIGASTVRRQWFVDPTKARNSRLLAVRHFDQDLALTKNAVLESTDSRKFEKGVASLLFLLGFSAVLPLETDAPDLIVTTPSGRLAIVECTTRIADFASKVGKLVHRRGSLSKSLGSSVQRLTVSAVLVCQLPRDQIAAQTSALGLHQVILLTGEDLAEAFNRLRFTTDPDRMLDDAIARIPGELN